MPVEQSGSRLSKEQKIGFVLLSIFAVLAVGLGVLQIRNTMYAPFALNKTVPHMTEDKNSPEVLSLRDTDKDGLNDFEELYVYQTSPYLEDTDSDSVSDKDEVQKGANPLCAEGKECFNETGLPAVSSAVSDPAVDATSTLQNAGDILSALMKDPVQLRQALLAAGFDKKILDSASDADLIKIANQVLASSSPF